MNGTTANSRFASTVLALPSRLAFLRAEGFPLIPSLILLTIMLVAIFAPVLAPHNPEVGVLGDRFRPPAWQTNGTADHFLGTDHLGRDVLSRLIFGARISVVVGLMVIIVAGAIGTALGIISGYLGRWVDQAIMRITDAWLAMPALMLAIFLAAIVGPGVSNIIIILAAVWWTRSVDSGKDSKEAMTTISCCVPRREQTESSTSHTCCTTRGPLPARRRGVLQRTPILMSRHSALCRSMPEPRRASRRDRFPLHTAHAGEYLSHHRW